MKMNDFSRYPTTQILADWRRFIRSGLRARPRLPQFWLSIWPVTAILGTCFR
jgi:hypothetical protein